MTNDLISQAQDAIQQGNKTAARIILRKAILKTPRNAQAWFLMARVVEDREQVIYCLQQGLRFDPDNLTVRNTLNALTRDRAPSNLLTTQVDLQEPSSIPAEIDFGTMENEPLQTTPPLKQTGLRINWSLVIGALIVFLVTCVALIGPQIAPRDPLEENVIIKIDGEWETPPLAPLRFKNNALVTDYVLGTDQFGRDLFSRILWAVQPTLVMVVTVALTRLFLGTLIGLAAGWATGSMSHWLDVLITGALAVPVFIVALGAIAMLGAEMGLMAFVIGFSINGWGETARIVREQTQSIKKNLYIEAAQALGAAQHRVVFGHVLRQIMPMIWMLLAFEISNTLMVTAGLGFLGYYIGGDVWIEVGDFVSRRVSGMPELGQMLATSWSYLTKPWAMLITGTAIFITILGFNLLGDGLRANLNPEIVKMNNPFRVKFQRLTWWWEEQIAMPAGNWARGHVPLVVLLSAIILIAGSGFYWWRTQIYPRTLVLGKTLPVPGDHLWAAERGDPYGTYWQDMRGPEQPQIQWNFQSSDGFAGGPAIAADGTIYIGDQSGLLIALRQDGQILWKSRLPEIPIGPPALGSEGVIFIGDQGGGLSAVSPAGELLWHFEQSDVGEPIHGPIVDLNGNIYYLLDDPRVDHLISITPDGELRWSIRTGTKAADVGPRLSPEGDVIYLKNHMINAEDGSQIEVETPADQDPVLANRSQYLVGADGNTYLAVGHTIIQWQPGNSGFEVVQTANWDYQSAGFRPGSNFPQDAGVTPDQIAWLFYSWLYGGTKIVWVDVSGRLIGISWTDLRQLSMPVALDNTNTAFICGVENTPQEDLPSIIKCLALVAGQDEPDWELTLDNQSGNDVIGTAMGFGNLYIVTDGGWMYAIEPGIGETQSQEDSAPTGQPEP